MEQFVLAVSLAAFGSFIIGTEIGRHITDDATQKALRHERNEHDRTAKFLEVARARLARSQHENKKLRGEIITNKLRNEILTNKKEAA